MYDTVNPQLLSKFKLFSVTCDTNKKIRFFEVDKLLKLCGHSFTFVLPSEHPGTGRRQS